MSSLTIRLTKAIFIALLWMIFVVLLSKGMGSHVFESWGTLVAWLHKSLINVVLMIVIMTYIPLFIWILFHAISEREYCRLHNNPKAYYYFLLSEEEKKQKYKILLKILNKNRN